MSEVKVNKISPRTNCGTVQLGDSGDTITIPAGATIVNNGTQTGFGRTGTVNWDTTAKTASFTAVSGNGYFVNTTSGAITMTLPTTPSAGDIVSFKDYAGTFATNNLTIGRNGSNLDGSASDKAIDTRNTSMSLVYVDGTQGWKSVEEGTGFIGEGFIVATGGTITTSGNCKIHTFTGPGTFTVCSVACTSANNIVSYLVVAGGGGGGGNRGGAGGAGGFREDKSPVTPYTASPLDGAGPITVTATGYPITVGGGGTGSADCVPATPAAGTQGSNSVFSTITSTGGGKGGGSPSPGAGAGGSGGGGPIGGPGEVGNSPPVTPPQGNNGGAGGPSGGGGGGGGATAVGTAGHPSPANPGGAGGAGATTSISGSPVARAGGGGGGNYFGPAVAPAGGTGGGGPGGHPGNNPGTDGTVNTGGGGGGGNANYGGGGNGGTGVVIIRYKYQ